MIQQKREKEPKIIYMNLNTYTNLPCLDLLFFKVDSDALKVRVSLKKG
jgi:hypothetical protein